MARTDGAFIWPGVCEACRSGGPSISQTGCSCPPAGAPRSCPGPLPPHPPGQLRLLGRLLSRTAMVRICAGAGQVSRTSSGHGSHSSEDRDAPCGSMQQSDPVL